MEGWEGIKRKDKGMEAFGCGEVEGGVGVFVEGKE